MAILMDPAAPLRGTALHERNHPAPFFVPAGGLMGLTAMSRWSWTPGLRPEDLEIELESDTLRSARAPGSLTATTARGSAVGRRIERAFGRFERSLRVPAGRPPVLSRRR